MNAIIFLTKILLLNRTAGIKERIFSTCLEVCDLEGVLYHIIMLLIYLRPRGKPAISHEAWEDFRAILDNKYYLWCKINICSPPSRLQIIQNSILMIWENGTSSLFSGSWLHWGVGINRSWIACSMSSQANISHCNNCLWVPGNAHRSGMGFSSAFRKHAGFPSINTVLWTVGSCFSGFTLYNSAVSHAENI